jgi:AcrR family transcriptional regulator
MVTRQNQGRPRMTGVQRREQLVTVARGLFAEKGFEPTSVEEIAARAGVSKPVVYEHFGGKEGIYAVVVDREVKELSGRLTSALNQRDHPKAIVERTALTLLDYIEADEDGFRILVRDSPVAQATGPFNSMLGDLAYTVEALLVQQFESHGLDPATAILYAQMLVGMIAFTGQWWLEAREPDKATVAAHLTNLGWNGLRGMVREPKLVTDPADRPG